MTEAQVWLLAPQQNFPAEIAAFLCSRHGADAPDFSAIDIVTPNAALGGALAAAIAEAMGGAVMSPRLQTLQQFLAPALPAAAMSELACRVRIAEAVTRFRHLFPGQTPLAVADALYGLFDELAQARVELPASEEGLRAFLARGYGLKRPLAALSREAQLVHTLYQAFLEEVGEQAPAVAERLALAERLARWPEARPLIFAGFDQLTAASAALIGNALQRLPQSAFFCQGRLEGRDAASTRRLMQQLGCSPKAWAALTATSSSSDGRALLLDAALADGEATERFQRRAEALAKQPGSDGGLQFTAASDAEHEAQMADLAVRQALLKGTGNVAVIAGDRRLARRLRARLERAGVALADRGGWALSTSRAAAALDSWLRCVEENFPFRALMDFLKSGLLPGGERWALQLEPLAFKKQISGGWLHWRRNAETAEEALRFESLQQAQLALATLRGSHAGAAHVQGLLASLDALGLRAEFARDDAGAKLLQVLDDLRGALAASSLKLSWPAFRALLDQSLEEASFTVSAPGARVQLLTLGQTQGLAADLVVLTGATAQLLAASDGAPFFNAGVRRELGLTTTEQAQALALTRLRRLLQAAPEVQVLFAPATAGEQALPAPALVALAAFAKAAGRPIAANGQLAEWAPQAEIATASPLPPAFLPPAPQAGAELVTVLRNSGLSAGGHNALVECPYRFHARYGLGLADAQAPDDPTDRSDYGDRVHHILHAFHSPQEGCPAPYDGEFGPHQLAAIVGHLRELADTVFADDVAERPLGRAWRAEFEQAVPWLAEQLVASGAAAIQTELELNTSFDGLVLKGSIDRLERREANLRVVDYKTGSVPKPGQIKAGESVQLAHYALAVAADAIAYWDIKEQKQQGLDGSDLEKLKDLLAARLQALTNAIERGSSLLAHGAPAVCGHCEYRGLCRNAADVRPLTEPT